MKAIQYIQRALRLDPNKTDAYTLMGHEYVELQNTSAAIQSYRKALGFFLRIFFIFSKIFFSFQK